MTDKNQIFPLLAHVDTGWNVGLHHHGRGSRCNDFTVAIAG